MTNEILLDTHIALWLDGGSNRLLSPARDRIDACWRDGGTILISAVTAWEIAQLVDTGRILLDVSVEAWLERFVNRPGIETVPLNNQTAARAYRLHHLEHRDPADRLLIGTAIVRSCPLLTYDERILSFGQTHGSQYGFSVV